MTLLCSSIIWDLALYFPLKSLYHIRMTPTAFVIKRPATHMHKVTRGLGKRSRITWFQNTSSFESANRMISLWAGEINSLNCLLHVYASYAYLTEINGRHTIILSYFYINFPRSVSAVTCFPGRIGIKSRWSYYTPY